MHVSTPSTFGLAASLLTAASLTSALNVVQMDISKPQLPSTPAQKSRAARRGTLPEPVENQKFQYVATVAIGTPPQTNMLQIDTGSSDTWFLATQANFCQQSQDNCPGGTYDYQSSSTAQVLSESGFQISYGDGTSTSGAYLSDNLAVGPDNGQITIKNQVIGLGLSTDDINYGLMGLGFANLESICDNSQPGQCDSPPTVPQNLVSQGAINSQAYSLWLNDLDADTGSILFGGIDTSRFVAPLVTVPMVEDAQTGIIDRVLITWTGLTLGTPNGPVTGFVPDDFAVAALLDSGATSMTLPTALAERIYAQFDAVRGQGTAYFASCSLRSSTATFDFAFGGSKGPVISVPIDELLRPQVGDDGRPLQLDNGDEACLIGVRASDEGPFVSLGDSFLRSAYVVYDLDNNAISLAQTVFNSTGSNVQEIKAGTNGVPNASAPASTVLPATSDISLGPSPTNTPSNGGAPLAQYTAANPSNPHETSQAAAAGLATFRPSFLVVDGAVWMAAATSAFVALGGSLLLL